MLTKLESSPLAEAIRQSNTIEVEQLITQYPLSLFLACSNEPNMLHFSIRYSNPNTIIVLINTAKKVLSDDFFKLILYSRDLVKCTIIHKAARYQNRDVLSVLITTLQDKAANFSILCCYNELLAVEMLNKNTSYNTNDMYRMLLSLMQQSLSGQKIPL